MMSNSDARKRTEAAQSSPGAGEVDRLAAEIRRVDGMHSLGAGALAETLMPWLADLIARVEAKAREGAWDEGVHVGYEARQNDEVDGLGGNQWWESPNVAANPYRADEQVTP